VEAFLQIQLTQLQELPRKQHRRCRAVTGHIVLLGLGALYHALRRVLDLHFVQKSFAVLGDFELAGSAHKHLQGSPGPEVCLHNFLETPLLAAIHLQGLRLLKDVLLRVNNRNHFYNSIIKKTI